MADTISQDATVDISKLYEQIIQDIDKYRSYVSVANNPALIKQMVNAIASSKSPDTFIQQIKPDPTQQESRCHTFYRRLGLPVIGPDGSLYSPGFDLDNSHKSDILKKHYQVITAINNQKPDLFTLMDARERNVNSFLKIFALSNLNNKIANINPSVLVLSSITGGKNYFKMRQFSSPLTNSSDPFDTDIKNQSYTICNDEPQNSVNTQDLTSYTDTSGNTAGYLFGRNDSGQIIGPGKQFILDDSPLIKRAHILKPFMVDPRVELTVNPPNNIICAPFVSDASKTNYTENIKLTTPIIEDICRKRFNKTNQQVNDPGTFGRLEDLVDYIKNSDEALDQQLLDKATKGITQTVEDDIFNNNINIIKSIIDKLYDAVEKIQEAEQSYHWIPIPNVKGPEFGIDTQDVEIISSSDGTGKIDPLSTDTEKQIVRLSAFVELATPSTQNTETDVGDFIFKNTQPVPDPKVVDGFGSRNENHLKDLLDKRAETTANAAEALKTIEIIMGEFSGLGLCDIMAIYTALWTVDKKVLVNMLDDEAFNRMIQDPTLLDNEVMARKSAGSPTLSGTDVLQKFEDKIKEIYAIMDKLLQDRFGFNSVNN